MTDTPEERPTIRAAVLGDLAVGLTDRETARRNHVSVRTVQRIIGEFKDETGSPTRFAAGVAACRLGLV